MGYNWPALHVRMQRVVHHVHMQLMMNGSLQRGMHVRMQQGMHGCLQQVMRARGCSE